jgi:hypothetical protein
MTSARKMIAMANRVLVYDDAPMLPAPADD